MTPDGIKKLRERLGLTQEKFAKLVFANRVTVARWESGANKPLGIYLRKLEDLAAKAKKRSMGKWTK
jgi:DNA-binding transcriptional regulator YiaG